MLKEEKIQVSAKDVFKRTYGIEKWNTDRDEIIDWLKKKTLKTLVDHYREELEEMEHNLRDLYDIAKGKPRYKNDLEELKVVSENLKQKKSLNVKIYTEKIDRLIIYLVFEVVQDVRQKECYVQLSDFREAIKRKKGEEVVKEMDVEFYFGILLVDNGRNEKKE